jgi:hypothetical protein
VREEIAVRNIDAISAVNGRIAKRRRWRSLWQRLWALVPRREFGDMS